MSKRYCVTIRDIPDAILDAKVIREHFENYGKINRLLLNDRNAFCEIYFNSREQVKRALKANICHGYKLNITTVPSVSACVSPDRQIEVYDEVDMDILSENESFGVDDDMKKYEKNSGMENARKSEIFFGDTRKFEKIAGNEYEKNSAIDDTKKYNFFGDMRTFEKIAGNEYEKNSGMGDSRKYNFFGDMRKFEKIAGNEYENNSGIDDTKKYNFFGDTRKFEKMAGNEYEKNSGIDDTKKYNFFGDTRKFEKIAGIEYEKNSVMEDSKKYEKFFGDTRKFEKIAGNEYEKNSGIDDTRKYEKFFGDTRKFEKKSGRDDSRKYETESNRNNNNMLGEENQKTSQKNIINLRTMVATTMEDKLTVLEERDKQLRELTTGERKINDSSEGTCPDMCPEKERLFRDLHKVCSIFECETIGDKSQVIPERLVKEYSRSSADQEFPLPHELRPEPILTTTMHYLISEIIPKIEIDPKIKLGEWYHFCWDRLRSIRKDIVQQQLCDLNTISIIEQCARFHICCYDLLFEQRPPIFDDKLNTENLVSCLQILQQMYNDLSILNIKCENEAEFRSYMILLQLNQCDFIWIYNDLSDEIKKSNYIKSAMQIYNAYSNNFYYQFFKIVENLPYLPCCIVQRFFTPIRIQALQIIINGHCSGNCSKTFQIDYFQKYLNFDNFTDTSNFLEKCGLEFNMENENEVKVSKSLFMIPEDMFKTATSANVVQRKRIPIARAVVDSEIVPSCPKLKVFTSFDENNLLKEEVIIAIIDNIARKKSITETNNCNKPSKKKYEYHENEDKGENLDEEDGEYLGKYGDYEKEENFSENGKYSEKWEDYSKNGGKNLEKYYSEDENDFQKTNNDDDEYMEELYEYSENCNDYEEDDNLKTNDEFEYEDIFNKSSKKLDEYCKMDNLVEMGLSNFMDHDMKENALEMKENEEEEVTNSNQTFPTTSPDVIFDFRVESTDKSEIADFPMESINEANDVQTIEPVVVDEEDVVENKMEMEYNEEEEEIEIIERKKKQHEILKKLIQKNIRKKYALKYGKIWKLKTKNILKERDSKRLKKLSIKEHLEMWGTVRRPHEITMNITKRIQGWNKTRVKADNLLNCDIVRPNYKGKQIAELLVQNLNEKVENCISWKLLISLPENCIESFVIKIEEILKILLYSNPETKFGEAQVTITSSGIKVLTSMIVEIGDMTRNGSDGNMAGNSIDRTGNKNAGNMAGDVISGNNPGNGITGIISRYDTGSPGNRAGFGEVTSGEMSQTGITGTNAVIFFLNNYGETTEDCINRLNRIIINGKNKLINIRLIVTKIVNNDDIEDHYVIVMKTLEEYKKLKLISNFTTQFWNNFLSIFHATAYLAKNSHCTYIPEIWNLSYFMVKMGENFLSTLIRHNDALTRVIGNNSSINALIDLYNKFIWKLHEILIGKKFEISNEFLKILIPDNIIYINNSKNDAIISNLINEFQLPKFKKWPPDSKKNLLNLLKKYCKFIDRSGMLYPTILRLLTKVRNNNEGGDDDIEEILKFTPWIAVLELWSKYKIKNTECNNTELSHAYVIFEKDDIKLITDHLWWLQNIV